MKTLGKQMWAYALVVLFLASVCSAQDRAKSHTWAIEINGQLCGYIDAVVSNAENDRGPYLLVEHNLIISATVLGLDVDQVINATFHLDPDTRQYTYFSRHVKAAQLDMRVEVVVDGDTASCTSSVSDKPRTVALPPGIILSDDMYLSYAKRDLVDRGLSEQDYQVLDPENHQTPVQTVTYTKVGTDVLETAIATYDVVIIDTLNKVTGQKTRMWLDTADGFVVNVVLPNGMEISLADPSIRDRIQRVNADDLILAKAETDISDVSAISYMKVQASMEPVGAWLDAEGLNVPGQRFEGEVSSNRVEGVFVIEHARYDGAGAPPYPPSFEGNESLAKFLAPGGFIAADDPVLVKKAREIAEGSADSWEAAVRLSTWVADNIGYEIPGGVFARKVYDMRVGECGGHSVLLASFCRAVGIPARGVWGCMYAPMGGGVFGQHAWTEIYMGETGWVPVDSTAHEADFVDSGHIRLGLFGSTEDGGATAIALGARKMEVLDYRLTGDTSEGTASAAGQYVAYVGAYDVPGFEEPFRVLVKNGRLGIDVPGQMVLPMNDPDADGNWTCTLTNLVYCSFGRDENGNVTNMTFHEIVRMRRKSDPEVIADDVPEDLHRYLGGYFFAQRNADFALIWDEGMLGLQNPRSGNVRHLEPTGEDGQWTIENGKKEISFILNDKGGVISMSADVGTDFPRQVDAIATAD